MEAKKSIVKKGRISKRKPKNHLPYRSTRPKKNINCTYSNYIKCIIEEQSVYAARNQIQMQDKVHDTGSTNAYHTASVPTEVDLFAAIGQNVAMVIKQIRHEQEEEMRHMQMRSLRDAARYSDDADANMDFLNADFDQVQL